MCNSLQPNDLGKVLTRSEEKGTASGEETNSKWPMVPLGEVLAQYKEYIECPEPKVYQKLSVKLYGKGVILDTPADGTALKMKRHQIAKAGQVILSEIWGKKGAIGFVPPEGDGALCTSHFFLFEFNPGRIAQKYLQAIFAANYLQGQLDAEAKGTTGYAAVRPKNLFDAKIPLPPLDEQRRIVACIEELAARIEEARELRRRAVDEADALLSAESKYFFNHDNIQAPRKLLKDIAIRITKGESPEWQGFSYQDNGAIFIRSENVLWGMLDLSNRICIPIEFHNKLNRSKLRSGDVLINLVGASIGRTCMVPSDFGEANINQAVAVISPNFKILNGEYLMHFLMSAPTQDIIQSVKVETARPNISLSDLRKLLIPVPNLIEQFHIITYLKGLQSKLDLLKRHQAETAEALDALLPAVLERAFRGEL